MTKLRLSVGSVLVAILGGAYLYLSIAKPGISGDLGAGDQIVVVVGVFSGFVLWVWMFSDFFKRKDLRYKVLWRWALFLANLLAAAIYFIVIYFPRERNDGKRGMPTAQSSL